MAKPIDFSQTQRIVLLIDLNPLLHLQNPNPYLSTLLTTSQTLLTFPPLSSSLFSFKFFFSSLSPLLSSSKVHSLLPKPPSLSLSFNHPTNTLLSLSKTLNSLSTFCNTSSSAAADSPPRALFTASSLRQILHDYGWECQNNDSLGMSIRFPIVRSNLVLLFSPIVKSLKFLSGFMNVEMDDELLNNVDCFCKKFRGFFDSLNDAFVGRDIHFSWVDVKYELECSEEKVEIDESELRLGFFENGIRSLGWGFCSSDSIILGSAIVPFRLIYSMIGVSANFCNSNDICKRIHAQLSLEISDVSGKPLECKCCDLDLIGLETLPRNRSDDVLRAWEFMNLQIGGGDQEKTFWGQFGAGIVKLHIKAVQKYDEFVKIEGCLSDMILVRGFLDEFGKDRKESYGDCFADRVLEMLTMEMGEFMQRKSVPIWQILLSFLCREGCWALVSLSNGSGGSCTGILKPFTVHSALLSIMDNGSSLYPDNSVNDIGGLNLNQFVTKTDNEIHKSNVDMKNSNGFMDSQSGSMSSKKCAARGDGKRKKNKRNSHLYQDLTWISFCKVAFEHSKMDLEEIYSARQCNSSKKLKFLKCWMKQVMKSRYCSLARPDRSKLHEDVPKGIEERLTVSHLEVEQLISSSVSAGEESLTGAFRIQDEAALDLHTKTSEDFFSNLSKKIQDGLESKGVDLGALAEHLVNSSILRLYQKHEMDTDLESQTPVVNLDDNCGSIVASELTKLLLREPKDLAARHKDDDTYLKASDPRSTGFASEHLLREYELQILFRMEILRSEVALSMEESTRQKFVKQICLLLDSIQCHLEGGFFGDWSLGNYVGRIIKSRYCHSLGDVVHKIYKKMDLLLFGGKDESPNSLLNSEDSNQSWREKQERDELGENSIMSEPVSAEDESLQLLGNHNGSPQGIKQEEHARRLIEAQERRERARRFASFTSWVPDLQRVWAPKQLKPMRTKLDSFRKLSKRKDRQRAGYDMVCETPMTGKKRPCSQGSSPADKNQDHGINSCSSVSKALFQDEG